jgi:hypothetical protein
MVRFLRFPKTLCAALAGAAFALAIPAAASADHWYGRRDFGFWLPPLPPPPPFFFPRSVHRHGPYCDHRYDRWERHDRYERHERRRDRHDERDERRERHDRW